jgi:hypothetical protein
MTPSPDSGELWRASPPPYGVSALPCCVLPPDRGDSSTSPPIAAELRPVDLALAAWSDPAGLAGASALASRCLRWPFISSSVGWQPATPMSPPGVVLGRSAMSTMPPPLPSQPLDGGLPATTVVAPMHRRHGPLPRSSVSSPVSYFSSPLSLCSCCGGLASEPGMLAYAVAPCLSLCCCCCPRAPLLAIVSYYC